MYVNICPLTWQGVLSCSGPIVPCAYVGELRVVMVRFDAGLRNIYFLPCSCCCCCCSHINSHNQSVVTGQAPVTGAEEYPREKHKQPKVVHACITADAFMPPPETYKSEIGIQSTMCQVHTGAYVSLLAPGKNDYTACHPRKTTTYILHAASITTHTHDRRKSIGKKETKKRKEDKGKERKEKGAKKNESGIDFWVIFIFPFCYLYLAAVLRTSLLFLLIFAVRQHSVDAVSAYVESTN